MEYMTMPIVLVARPGSCPVHGDRGEAVERELQAVLDRIDGGHHEPELSEVPAESVPARVHAAAICAFEFACRDLAIALPRLHWIRSATWSHSAETRVHDGEPVALLRGDLTPAAAFRVGLHEARHCWQHRLGDPVESPEDPLYRVHEGDAEDYVEDFLRRFPGLAAEFFFPSRAVAR